MKVSLIDYPCITILGGVFNNFILWFDCNMEPVPEIFAEIAAKICLPNAKPVLLQHKNFTTSPVRP